jgi:hypothetical protein
MTDETKLSSRGLRVPANWREITAERAGTVFGIVGAEHYRQRPPVSKTEEPKND